MPDALSRLCRKRLGIDLASLSEDQLRAHLPAIVEAVHAETVDTSNLLKRQRFEVAKAASLRAHSLASFIPNGEFIRDETLPPFDSWSQSADPNSCLESILPI
ncbi:hypothetical protein [Blastopirellula marina]|uniref:Uncharacterized protein n=1 Tax=Blastopirellula marina DSM 3645 TaxID=314230 RepID=A3ZPQ7_9BACT|nr:hypothetical protein [Blastopirellula marina]EAQ81735.1 hypothetical protein DSM3645_29177 [Blastopirellula marina DSM 3645]